MAERKIVVPQGMINAVLATGSGHPVDVCTAVIRWLSENPIVPTHDQAIHLCETFEDKGGSRKVDYCDSIRAVAVEWQHIMFLAPEREVPEEIRDILLLERDQFQKFKVRGRTFDEAVIEAYRRGQQSK